MKCCNTHHQIFKISRDKRDQNQSVKDKQLLEILGKILWSVRIRPNIFGNSRTVRVGPEPQVLKSWTERTPNHEDNWLSTPRLPTFHPRGNFPIQTQENLSAFFYWTGYNVIVQLFSHKCDRTLFTRFVLTLEFL